MLRTKTDVDKHVQGLLRKVKNDHERTLKCYHIAQLYHKVQDYESARRYVITYLSVRDDSSSAHKLFGNILEAMGQKDKAMSAYKKSLEIEANQSDLVLKMCELLCDKDVTFDPAKAQYWSERASSMFPNGPIVFMLKEKLLSTNKDMNSEDFENLFNAQLKSKPSDVEVRIKLLKLYLESGRCEIALSHVFEVEQKQGHSNQLSWYKCINTICEKYSKEFPDKCNWEFYMQWLSALDRLCALSTSETLLQPSNLVEATEAIYSLDQVLFKGNKLVNKSPDLFREFFKHLSYQLAFHIGVLLLKRAKKENSLWKEVKKMICPLFLISSNEPPNVDAAWSMSIKDYHRKLLNLWAHYAQCRIVQVGHVLLSLAKGSKSEKSFMDRVLHFTETDWNQQVFQKIFKTIDNSNLATSYLVTADIYSEIPHILLPKSSLTPYLFVPSFELTYAGSLHHLVWLGLQCFSNPCSPLLCKLDPSFRTTSFKSLQYTINNLNNTGVETLNQLDVDSFLYATVFCAGVLLEDQKSNGFFTPTEKPNLLTPDITPLLCTADQATWWINACSIVKVGLPQTDVKNKVSDMRHCLQRGIEVVRGDGLPLPLIICLARTFALRASEFESDERSRGCEDRALYLWSIAIPQLERLVEKHMVVSSRNSKLFEYIIKELSTNEMSSLLEEGRFFVACHYMKTNQHEKALTAFKPLHSPQAVFNQALIYQKLAQEHIHTLPAEEVTSELRCQHTVMATKARDCLYQVRDMIKGDATHPLQQQFKAKLMEIDDLLSRMEPENGMPERDGYLSEASLFYGSDGSPAGNVVNGGAHGQSFSRNKPFPASTPNRYYESYRHRSTTAEIVELLNIYLNTNQLKTQQVLEQSRLVLDRLENVVFEQRNQRSLIEDLINKVSKLDLETKNNIADLKKEIKRPDLYNMLDEDDYQEDPLHYPNLPIYSQRGLQGNNSVPYAAPSFFSPRVDQMYQNNLGFYNQAPLPFSDTQQVSDFLRSVPQSSQISAPLTHKMNSSIQSPLVQNLPTHLNLNLANQTVAPTLTSFAGQRLTSQLGQARSGLTPASMSGPNNVVITTSDTLPTSAPPVQPTLSVTIPAQYRLGGAPHNFQITMPPEMKAVTEQVAAAAAAANTSISESEQELESDIQLPEHDPLPGYHESDVQLPEHDPLPGYQPLIPLPPKVDITTGEENEKVLFECRAKLFRFVGKEWKERGIGLLKILKDNTTEKCRILMRREQVHKICANHLISSDMALNPMPCSDRAWIWVANDFADEKLQLEKLSAKFKTVEEAQLFKESFESAKAQSVTPQKTSCGTESASNSKTNQQQPIQNVISNRGSNILTPPKFNLSSLSNISSNDSNLSITNLSSSVLSTSNGDKSKESFSIQMGSSKMPEKSNTEALSLGGFTFLSPPKLKIEEKKEKETVVENKTESPFATFTFATPTTTGTPMLKDLLKPASAKSILKEPQFKTPETQKQVMFSSSGSDFGTLAKLSLNSTSSNSTPVKPFQGSVSLLFSGGVSTGSFQGASPSSPNVEDDFVPNNEFKPVIPLPELVDVKSGEENEDVLFEERAKLLRFCKKTKEWKERGIGKIKILKDQTTGVIRLLMRRDQVLKVCCNHRLTKDIELKPFPSSDKAATWAVKDYSEEVGKDEVFTIRFKTSEQVQAFKAAFLKAQESLGAEDCSNISSNITSNKKPSDKPKLTDLFKPPAGSWNCELCYVRNGADQIACPACGTCKPGVTPQKPSTFTFGIPPGGAPTKVENKLEVKSTPGSWECESCYIRNDSNVTICVACGSPKPGSSAEKPEQTFTFGVSQSAFNTGSSNKENKSFFGGQKCDSTTESGSQYVFGTQTSDTKKEEQKNDTSGFSFGTSTAQQDSLSSGFTFGTQTGGESTNPSGFTFGTPTNHSTGSKFGFGSSTFSFSMAPTTAISNKSPKTDDSGSEFEEEEDTEDHKTFKPVIPLPDEIKVITGEENESVLFCNHAKLYRYDGKNTEWKERGVGDIKILRHNENGKIRLLMRREAVKKLCLNHYITNDINMIPKDEKSWLWYAIDFSEENASQEKFSIRFRTQIIAEEFKKALDDAKALLKGGSYPSEKKQEDTTDQDSSLILPEKTTNSKELEITFEKTVSAEDRAKALALMLPPNFYSYLNAPPCPGCVGCEPNEDEVELHDNKLEPTATLFGNKTSLQNSFFGGTPSVFPLKEAGFSFGKVSKDKSEGNTVDTPTSQSILFDNTSTPLKHPLTVIDKKFDIKSPVAAEKSIFGNLSTGVPSKTGGLFSQVVGKPTTPGSFFPQSMPSFTSMTSTPTNIFGNKNVNPTEAAMPSPTFLNKEATTFSALASTANSEKSFSIASNFKWEGAGRTVFGSGGPLSAAEVSSTSHLNESRESDDEGGNVDETVEEHDPQFAPIISLPAEVDLKTGEEDEDIVFNSRVKLFRYDANLKEWKERGVGEMKLLKHRLNNTYRLLMRREQVYKIVCNHLLTPDILMSPLKDSEKSLCWLAMNMAQDYVKPEPESLAVRFKNADLALSFKAKVDDAIAAVTEARINESESSFYSIAQTSRIEEQEVLISVQANTTILTGADSIVLLDSEICIIPGSNDNNSKIVFKDKNGPVVICLINQSTLLNTNGCEMTLEAVDEITSVVAKISSSMKNLEDLNSFNDVFLDCKKDATKSH